MWEREEEEGVGPNEGQIGDFFKLIGGRKRCEKRGRVKKGFVCAFKSGKQKRWGGKGKGKNH